MHSHPVQSVNLECVGSYRYQDGSRWICILYNGVKIKILVITDPANGDYNVEETDLLTGHGVCSCAEIHNGATVEAGKDKVETRTPDKEWEDE